MKLKSRLLLLIASAALLSACSSQRAVYSEEDFASDSPFKQRFQSEVAPACESARRVLLGQGYLMEMANSDSIKARKAVQRQDKPNTFIEMNIACLADPAGSTVFATGLLTTYALKKSSSSASVGVSAVGSISLPIGQSADSLVKVSEDTIEDTAFYRRFFTAVRGTLEEMQPALEQAPGEQPATPEPAMPETESDPDETLIDAEFTAAPAGPYSEPESAPGVYLREGPILIPEAAGDTDASVTPPPLTPAPMAEPGLETEAATPPPAEPGETPVEQETAPETAPASADALSGAEPVLPAPDAAETEAAAEALPEPAPVERSIYYSDPAEWNYDEEE